MFSTKTLLISLFISFTATSVASAEASASLAKSFEKSGSAPRAQTFLIYLAGDNDLSDFLETSTLKRLEREKSSDQIHVVIQFDGNKTNDSKRLYLSKRGFQILEENVEYNSGSAQTLTDFVDWGVTHFPSEKLILMLYGHGRGIVNVPDPIQQMDLQDVKTLASMNDVTSKEYMNESDLVYRMKKVLKNRKIDLFIYNSCLMGNLEILSTISKIANYAVASEYPICFKGNDDFTR